MVTRRDEKYRKLYALGLAWSITMDIKMITELEKERKSEKGSRDKSRR